MTRQSTFCIFALLGLPKCKSYAFEGFETPFDVGIWSINREPDRMIEKRTSRSNYHVLFQHIWDTIGYRISPVCKHLYVICTPMLQCLYFLEGHHPLSNVRRCNCGTSYIANRSGAIKVDTISQRTKTRILPTFQKGAILKRVYMDTYGYGGLPEYPYKIKGLR